jgi:hypothetical protein
MLEHMGIRWGYVFLRTASYISEDEVKELMVQAVEMYLQGDAERNIKSPRPDLKARYIPSRSMKCWERLAGSGLTLS